MQKKKGFFLHREPKETGGAWVQSRGKKGGNCDLGAGSQKEKEKKKKNRAQLRQRGKGG